MINPSAWWIPPVGEPLNCHIRLPVLLVSGVTVNFTIYCSRFKESKEKMRGVPFIWRKRQVRGETKKIIIIQITMTQLTCKCIWKDICSVTITFLKKRLTNENKALFKAGIPPNLCFVTCLTWFMKYFSFQRLCNIHLVLRELIKCAQPLQCENLQSVYSISTHILSQNIIINDIFTI